MESIQQADNRLGGKLNKAPCATFTILMFFCQQLIYGGRMGLYPQQLGTDLD